MKRACETTSDGLTRKGFQPRTEKRITWEPKNILKKYWTKSPNLMLKYSSLQVQESQTTPKVPAPLGTMERPRIPE